MSKIIKIANGQGFWGDSIDAPVDLIKNGNIDYLTLDYLAEVTLSIMQRQKLKNPRAGYAKDFVDLIERIILEIIDKNVKIITNAGGVNPLACRDAILKIASKNNINLKVGIIQGDDIFDEMESLINKGINFNNLDNGKPISEIKGKIYSSNVYIDSFSIAEALKKGAQIVLAGRVSDPGLALGPSIYEFGWKKNDYNLLALGTLAGHITECGAQCTGGNYTRWKDVQDIENIGYPIIEIKSNGKFSITKHKNSGGLINRYTVIEQILYEMGNPKQYISPDVCVDFTTIDLQENGYNRVDVNNVNGFQPTDTYKVSISYFGGYKATGQLTVSGPDALEKSKLVAKCIWNRLEKAGCTYRESITEFLGLSSCHHDINPLPNQINEIVVRLSVKDNDKEKIDRFGKEIAPVITNGPPGVTGFAGGRPKSQEIIAYWPALIPKKLVQTKVSVNEN